MIKEISFKPVRGKDEYELTILFDRKKHRDSINTIIRMLIEHKLKYNEFNLEMGSIRV